MTDPAVALEKITKTFPVPFQRRVIVALRDVSLRVSTGEIYGLLGPNGSGKSTTLKIILGLVSPTRGQVQIFGHDAASAQSRANVGFLPESPYFPKYLTAAEMLSFYGKLCGMRRRELAKRVDELLELVGLTAARDRRLGTFSKGMLQRIGLAQAVINEPEMVVLDEPTAGVDPAGTRVIRDLILELKRRGVTILLSSHLLGQVQEICDRIGILANGALVRDGRVDELLIAPDQTELVLEHASPQLVDRISKAAAEGGASVIRAAPRHRSLEQVFLEATTEK